MPDMSKIQHNIKSKAVSLKEAAELLPRCPEEKRLGRVALMRETAQDIARLLTELETELKNPAAGQP
jgi:hypothetical protein